MTHGLDTGFMVAAEVAEHAEHAAARRTLDRLLKAGDLIAVAPQVLAEFIHVVTDPRRFAEALDMTTPFHVHHTESNDDTTLNLSQTQDMRVSTVVS